MSLFSDIQADEEKRSEAKNKTLVPANSIYSDILNNGFKDETQTQKTTEVEKVPAKSIYADILSDTTKEDVIGVAPAKKPVIDSSGLNFKERRIQKENLKERSVPVRALLRGVDQAQGMGYGAIGLAASAVGADKVRDWGFKGYKKNVKEAKMNPDTSKEFTSIVSDFRKRGVMGTAYDVAEMATATLGEMAPAAAETMISAAIGAALGGGVPGAIAGAAGKTGVKALIKSAIDFEIKRNIKKGIYKGMTSEAMEAAAARKIAAGIAIVASSSAKEAGSMFMTDAERRGIEKANPFSAATLGTISGATELFSPLAGLVGKFTKLPSGVPQKLTGEAYESTVSGIKNFLKRAGKEIPKSMGKEGVQEVVQEFLSIANERITGAEAPDDWKETAKRFINTFAAGAVGGAAFGVIGAKAGLQNVQIGKEEEAPTKGEYDDDYIKDLRNKMSANDNKYKIAERQLKEDPTSVSAQAIMNELDTQRDELKAKLDEQLITKKQFTDREKTKKDLDEAAFGDSINFVIPKKSEIMDKLASDKLTKEEWDNTDKTEFTEKEKSDIKKELQVKEDKDFINKINETGEIPIAKDTAPVVNNLTEFKDLASKGKKQIATGMNNEFELMPDQTQYDYGKLAGYSEADIAYHYLTFVKNNRDLTEEESFEEFKKDKNNSKITKDQIEAPKIRTQPPGVEDTPDDAFIKELQDGINRQSEGSAVYGRSSVTTSTKRSEQDHVADSMASLLGYRIVRFKENNPDAMPVRGAFSPTNNKVLYINEDNEKSADWVFGHEFTHSLKENNPESFNTLMSVAQEGMNEEQKGLYDKKLRDAIKREGKGEASDLVEEEMLADFVGDQFSSMRFWDNLYRENPTHFEKIVTALKNLISKIIGNRGSFSKDPISNDFFNNITKLEKTLSDVTKNYIGEIGAIETITTKFGGTPRTVDVGTNRYTEVSLGGDATAGIREDDNTVYLESHSMGSDEVQFTKGLVTILNYAKSKGKKVTVVGTGGTSNQFFKNLGFVSGAGNNSYFFPIPFRNLDDMEIDRIKPVVGETPKVKVLPDAEVAMKMDGAMKIAPAAIKEMEKKMRDLESLYKKAKDEYKEFASKENLDKMNALKEERDNLRASFKEAVFEEIKIRNISVKMMPGFVKEAEKQWKDVRKLYRAAKKKYKETELKEDYNKMISLREEKNDLKDIFEKSIAEANGRVVVEQGEVPISSEIKNLIDNGGEIDHEAVTKAKKAYDLATRMFVLEESNDAEDRLFDAELAYVTAYSIEKYYNKVNEVKEDGVEETETELNRVNKELDAINSKILEEEKILIEAKEKEVESDIRDSEKRLSKLKSEYGIVERDKSRIVSPAMLNQLAFLLNKVVGLREDAYDSLEEFDEYIELNRILREDNPSLERKVNLENRIEMMESDGVRTRHIKDARNVEIVNAKIDEIEADLIEITKRTPQQIATDAMKEYNERNAAAELEKENTDKFADFQKFAKGDKTSKDLEKEKADKLAADIAEDDERRAINAERFIAENEARKAAGAAAGGTQGVRQTVAVRRAAKVKKAKGEARKPTPGSNKVFDRTMNMLFQSLSDPIIEGQTAESMLEQASIAAATELGVSPSLADEFVTERLTEMMGLSNNAINGVKEDSQPKRKLKKSKVEPEVQKVEREKTLEDLITDQKQDMAETLNRSVDEVSLEKQLYVLHDKLAESTNPYTDNSINEEIADVLERIAEQEASKPDFKFSRKDNAYGLDTKDPNPEVEEAMSSAKIPSESWMDKATTNAKDFIKASLSPYKELGPGKFGQLKNWLRLLKNSSKYGAYRAWETVYSNVKVLDKAEREVFNRVLVLTDVLRDTIPDKEGFSLLDNGWMPFKLGTIENAKTSLRHFQEQARKSPNVMKALAQRRSQLKAVQTELVELGFLPERVLTDQNYFHHQVLEHMVREDNFVMFNQQQSVKARKASFQRARQGDLGAYNTEYMSSEYDMLSKAHEMIHSKRLRMKVKKEYDIFQSVLKRSKAEAKEMGMTGNEWATYIPPGYTTFKPDPGMNWSMVWTAPDEALKKILANENISIDDLVKGVVKMPDETWVVPEEVAKTLEELQAPVKKTETIDIFQKQFITIWKKWTLMNPFRFFKYSTNNLSGDVDAVTAYDSRIFGYARQAFSDVRSDTKAMGAKAFGAERGAKDVTPELRESLDKAHEYDVIGSGFVLHEIQDIDEDFKEIMEGPRKFKLSNTLMGNIKEVGSQVSRPFEWWMANTKEINNIRENTLRLAAFRFFKDRIDLGEKYVYGASNPLEIDDITDPWEKAAKLSRDLIGDYGNLTETGNWVRNNLIPFYSWMEINAPRYYWMMKNAKHEGRDQTEVLKTLSWKAAKKTTTIVAKFMAFSATVALYNVTFFSDEEKDLSPDQRRKMHLILGRNQDGSVRYLPISGAFRDALGWFGGEDIDYDIKDIMDGKASPIKKIAEILPAASNKLFGGSRPIFKSALIEPLVGKTFYPDMWNPRPIHNKFDHIARSFSMELITRKVMGMPTRGIDDDFSSRLYQSIDPGEAAYYNIRKIVNNFKEEQRGIEMPSHTPDSKANALHYYKQSLRFSDLKAAGRYLEKYYDLGGTLEGAKISIKLSEPTGGLPKELKSKFYKTLTREEKKDLNEASKWYKKNYTDQSRLVKNH